MGRFLLCYIVLSCTSILNIMASNSSNENGNGLLLYLHNYSFYAQKAMIALFEKKLPFKQSVVDITSGENYKPWFLDINPRGEVPVLKDGVKIIPDSSRIIDYLEDNFSNGDHPRLIPQDPVQKQKMNNFRELIDRINANTVTIGTFYHPDLAQNQKYPFIAPVRKVMKADFDKNGEKLRKIAEENPKYKDILLQKAEATEKTRDLVANKESFLKLLDQVDETLSAVETELTSHTDRESWLVSREFTVADVGLTMLLDRLNLVGLAHRYWEAGVRPQVTDYFKRAQLRESYKKTVPGVMFHIKALVGFKVLAGLGTLCAAVGGGIYWWRRKPE
ncbi:ganglioside-induced differentiation-associated protein 1 isoform X2 [Halyomorpha halys]|uniref:ganglioside-induced differentiation-associated protein 1 isoform X2 n=1 Tax=Halyomorpha halys TaxID=286706 RepID=UPI0006D50397|nr:ganglioside-induced differentiation-associated protein 1-like isoform X2 [Halyomorpha halys]